MTIVAASEGDISGCDLNRNGVIDRDEVVRVIGAYLFGETVNTAPDPSQLSNMIARVGPAVVQVDSTDVQGSGVIFRTEGTNAYVVTNQHVVGYDTNVRVTLSGRDTVDGYVSGADAVQDLAVVRIPCQNCISAPFGDSMPLKVGDTVVAIGYPLDHIQPSATLPRPPKVPDRDHSPVTATQGIVSAFRYDELGTRELVQTDASINPGNSGGPLFNLNGEIVGINTFKIYQADNLGYAVLETTVQNRLPALLSGNLPRPQRDPRVQLIEIFGPLDGHLHHEPDNESFQRFNANISRQNVVTRAWVQNPYSGDQPFSYGFRLRMAVEEPHLIFYVHSNGYWAITKRTGGDTEVIASATAPNLRTADDHWNYISALAVGDEALFFLNGQWLTTDDGRDRFSLGTDTGAGDAALINGYIVGTERAGAITHFSGFTVWEPELYYVGSGVTVEDYMRHVEDEWQKGSPTGAEATPAEAEVAGPDLPVDGMGNVTDGGNDLASPTAASPRNTGTSRRPRTRP